MKMNATCDVGSRPHNRNSVTSSWPFRVVLAVCLVAGAWRVGAANTRTWNGGGADNNWGTSANWGSSGTPITDDALVFQGSTKLSPHNNIANLTLSRIGTLTVNSTGFNIGGNPLQLGGNWAVGYGATWAINSTLSQNISITESRSGTALTFSGLLDNNVNTLTLLGAGNFTFSGAISGSGGLTLNGSGTASLSTANSYSGLTTVTSGTLKLGVANAIPRLTGYTANYMNLSGAGAILDLNGHALSCNALIGYGTVTSSSASPVLTVGSSEAAYDGLGLSGPITGSTAFTKDGTDLFYLDGASSYSGDTTISAGTLQMRATACLPFGSGVGNLTINSGATLDLRGSDTQVNGLSGAGKVSNNSDATDAMFTVGNNDASSTFTGAIDDSGGTYQVALTKTGAGTLTLSGANNYRGDSTLNAGTLVVNGSLGSASAVAVNAGATLSGSGTVGGSITMADDVTAVLYPNSRSTLTVGGDITVDANSTTKFDLSGNSASGNDQVVMENSTLTITGSPQVTINPTEGSLSTADYVLFNVGSSGTISGSFSTVPNWTTPPPFSAGYSVITVGNTIVLRYTAIAITVTAASNTKMYDGTTNAAATPTITSGTLDTGDTGAFTESYSNRNVASGKALTPSGTIRDSGSNDVSSRYNITWAGANVGTITVATLTYTATGVHRNYGSANPTFSGSISGFASGDNQGNATTGTLSFTSSATTGTAAGSYAINGSGLTANNGNYTFAQASGNATGLTIDPLAITLSGTHIYNRLATAVASILTIGNNLDGANLTLSGTANLASKNVGTRAISAGTLALGGSAAGNYTLSGLSGSVTITLKNANLSGLSASDKFYDGTTAATLTGTAAIASGDVVSGDDVSLVSGSTPTGAFVDRELGNAKSVPYASAFSLSGADASNYNLVLPSLAASILNHKEDSGTTTNTSANSLTFGLILNNGKMLADNDPAGGSINGAGTIAVNTNAILGGTGKVGGVTVNSGGTIAPGDNAGALTSGSETWNSGGVYAFQMSGATGTAGTNWDLLRITGNLDVEATISNAFTVKVSSLNGAVPGQAANFDNTQDYQWPIATVTGSISNFDATKFIVDTNQFQNNPGGGQFSIQLSSDQKSLNLVFTHTCGMNLTTSTYAIGADGKVHMYFSNPFGMLNAVALALNNCTIAGGMAYGPGFQSGQPLVGLPLTFVGASVALPSGTTRLELVASKTNTSQTAVVNVLVNDACGGKGGFDPVVADLEVWQGGVARESFSDVPASDRYVRVINGTPGLNWLCLTVNGHLFVLNPLADGQDVMVDVGAAMGEGVTNVVAVCGQGGAGAIASITIGDSFGDDLTSALTPTGSDAQYWSSVAGAGENPVLQITASGGNLVLSWSDMWDGFSVQARTSLAPEASWVPLEATPGLANGRFTVRVPASSGMLFRLSNP
jgi:fibronectin-binding autotransporter adhesin